MTAARARRRTGSRRRAGSARETCTHESERLAEGKLGAGAVAAVTIFKLAGLEPALGHHQAMRDAEQLRVGKLDAGARVAVIVQHVDSCGGELGIQAIADFADTR